MSLTYDAPDVAKEKLQKSLAVDLVGIQGLKIPIKLNSQLTIPSQLSIFASLDDPYTRGIHMSRMYLAVHSHFSQGIFKISKLKKLLMGTVKDQKGLSFSSRVEISLDWPVERKSLKSSILGWRVYPVFIRADYSQKKNNFEVTVGADVTYSSTCPCSASLSHEIIKNRFTNQFSKKKLINTKEVLKWFENKESLAATPHAQKSIVRFKLKVKPDKIDKFSILNCIDGVEKTLGTPVQTAVKRADEAEFARLNATNLMFCEDAVRKVGAYFKNKKNVLDYIIKVQHDESLHPFAVESYIVKGIKNGWRA